MSEKPQFEVQPTAPGESLLSPTDFHRLTYRSPASSCSSRRLRLYCLPYGGGHPSIFDGWIQPLAESGIEVVPLHLPDLVDTVHSLDAAVDILESVIRHWPSSYALYGHSYGALLAYALSVRMEACGIPPEHLFVGGYTMVQFDNMLFARAFRPIFVALGHPNIPWSVAPVDRLMVGTCMSFGDHGHMFKDVDRLLRVLQTIEGAQGRFDACNLSIPISALHGIDDPVVHFMDADWSSATRGQCEVELFDGDHYFIHAAESQRQVLRFISSRLEAYSGCPSQ